MKSKGSPRNPAWAPQEHIFYRSRALDVADDRPKWCEPLLPLCACSPIPSWLARFADASTDVFLQPAAMPGCPAPAQQPRHGPPGRWMAAYPSLPINSRLHCHGHTVQPRNSGWYCRCAPRLSEQSRGAAPAGLCA